MKRYDMVLTIAGSDSGGGAGIQADIKTLSSLGVYSTSVVTALTAQNTCGVKAVMKVPASFVNMQLDAVMTDFDIDAIKIGMLGSSDVLGAVTSFVSAVDGRIPVVFDPVLHSTSGRPLLDTASPGDLSELMRHVTVITPNIPEARVLTGIEIDDVAAMVRAGRALLARGCRAALVKGGHLDQRLLTDVLVMHDRPSRLFITCKVDSHNLHGTGCTLSSAIAAYMARGERLEKAVESAETYVKKAIFAGSDVRVGHGNGPLCHAFAPEAMHKSNI